MTDARPNRLLDAINSPDDLKDRSRGELKQIADELRDEVIDVVSVTGGHLGSGLGVVELTLAIHSVFDTPDDKLIFDVGHQCYPHKILTGRRDQMRTLRRAWWIVRLHQARGKRIRPVWCGARLHIDFCGAWVCESARHTGRRYARRVRYRGWVDVSWHGL